MTGDPEVIEKDLPSKVRYNEGSSAAYYDGQISNCLIVLLGVILQYLKEYGFLPLQAILLESWY